MSKYSEQQELQFPVDDGLHKLRDDRDIMSMPYFAAGAKGKVIQSIRVELETAKDNSWVDIKGTQDGIADLFDKRILLWIRMMIDQSRLNGREVSRTVVFSPNDYFQAIGNRRPSKKDYVAFEKSLDRLKGTYLKSSVDAVLPSGDVLRGNTRRGWIDEADYLSITALTGSRVAACGFGSLNGCLRFGWKIAGRWLFLGNISKSPRRSACEYTSCADVLSEPNGRLSA